MEIIFTGFLRSRRKADRRHARDAGDRYVQRRLVVRFFDSGERRIESRCSQSLIRCSYDPWWHIHWFSRACLAAVPHALPLLYT